MTDQKKKDHITQYPKRSDDDITELHDEVLVYQKKHKSVNWNFFIKKYPDKLDIIYIIMYWEDEDYESNLEKLIKAKWNINKTMYIQHRTEDTGYWWTPLENACACNNTSSVRILLRNGAKPTTSEGWNKILIRAIKDDMGYSPYGYPVNDAYKTTYNIIREFIEAGAIFEFNDNAIVTIVGDYLHKVNYRDIKEHKYHKPLNDAIIKYKTESLDNFKRRSDIGTVWEYYAEEVERQAEIDADCK